MTCKDIRGERWCIWVGKELVIILVLSDIWTSGWYAGMWFSGGVITNTLNLHAIVVVAQAVACRFWIQLRSFRKTCICIFLTPAILTHHFTPTPPSSYDTFLILWCHLFATFLVPSTIANYDLDAALHAFTSIYSNACIQLPSTHSNQLMINNHWLNHHQQP